MKQYPSNVLKQAQAALSAWNQISATLTYGTLTPESLRADIAAAAALAAEMAELEAQLTDKRNQRHAVCLSMWGKVKRLRSGIKATYGDDSSQYEMIGGTRLSERKPAVRRAVKA